MESLYGVSVRAVCRGAPEDDVGLGVVHTVGCPPRLHPPSGYVPSSRGWDEPHLRASCPSGLWDNQDWEPGQSLGL